MTSSTKSERDRVHNHVLSQVTRLQAGYLAGTSRSRADVSHLRRAIGKPLGSDPAILPLVIDPSSRDSQLDQPTRGENAVLGALSLYALHQQSQTGPMHRVGVRFGQALSRIRMDGGNERQGVIRRFDALMTATSFSEVMSKARGLVQLLKQSDEGFDYALFSEDLYRIQSPYSADAVRLRWGRDIYRVPSDDNPNHEGDAQ